MTAYSEYITLCQKFKPIIDYLDWFRNKHILYHIDSSIHDALKAIEPLRDNFEYAGVKIDGYGRNHLWIGSGLRLLYQDEKERITLYDRYRPIGKELNSDECEIISKYGDKIMEFVAPNRKDKFSEIVSASNNIDNYHKLGFTIYGGFLINYIGDKNNSSSSRVFTRMKWDPYYDAKHLNFYDENDKSDFFSLSYLPHSLLAIEQISDMLVEKFKSIESRNREMYTKNCEILYPIERFKLAKDLAKSILGDTVGESC